MRQLVLLSVCIFYIVSIVDAHLVFKKNGKPVFEFRDDGNAWFQQNYAEYQSSSVEPGEISINYNGSPMLWSVSNGSVYLRNAMRYNSSIPGTGIKFLRDTQRNAELSTNGECQLKGQQYRVSVLSIRFNHATGAEHDALTIRQNRDTAVHSPEYTNQWSDPAAYIANKQVNIMVKFSVEPSTVNSVELQGISNINNGILGNTDSRIVNFTNGLSGEESFSFPVNTPQMIYKSVNYWDWNAVEGNERLFMSLTGPHTLYTVLDTPALPWTQLDGDPQNPWVSALDFAIDPTKCNMKNATTTAAAVSAAGNFIFYNFGLHYDTYYGAPQYAMNHYFSFYNLSGYMQQSYGNIVNCYDQAGALTLLTTLVGGEAEYLFMQPYGYLNLTNMIGVGSCNNPFFSSQGTPYNVPIVGQDDPNRTGFGNHAFMRLNGSSGNIFDDCGGPYLGSGNTQAFIDANIDKSTPDEASRGGNINSITIFPNTTTFIN